MMVVNDKHQPALILPEIDRIIEAIPSVSGHPQRDTLLLRTLKETGGNISRVLELKPENIGIASIALEKSDAPADAVNRWLLYRVSDLLCAGLQAYIKAKDIQHGRPVFPANRDNNKPLSRWYLWWVVSKAAEKAGIEELYPGVTTVDIRKGARKSGQVEEIAK